MYVMLGELLRKHLSALMWKKQEKIRINSVESCHHFLANNSEVVVETNREKVEVELSYGIMFIAVNQLEVEISCFEKQTKII